MSAPARHTYRTVKNVSQEPGLLSSAMIAVESSREIDLAISDCGARRVFCSPARRWSLTRWRLGGPVPYFHAAGFEHFERDEEATSAIRRPAGSGVTTSILRGRFGRCVTNHVVQDRALPHRRGKIAQEAMETGEEESAHAAFVTIDDAERVTLRDLMLKNNLKEDEPGVSSGSGRFVFPVPVGVAAFFEMLRAAGEIRIRRSFSAAADSRYTPG